MKVAILKKRVAWLLASVIAAPWVFAAPVRWAIVRTIVTYFCTWTLLCALLVFWKPLIAIGIYATLGLIAILGTRTSFPKSFKQAATIWRNLMSGIQLMPLAEARRRVRARAAAATES